MSSAQVAAPLAEFVSGLLSTGQVTVCRSPDLTAEAAQVRLLLEEAFQHALAELAGPVDAALVYIPACGAEAAHFFYRLCLALTDRSMTEDQVKSLCAAMPAAPALPAEVLSADIVLRHLPELHKMARAISPDDPLVAGLEQVALRFPLSSIGIPLPRPPDLTLLHRHSGLWRLYVDRVLERQDVSRLADPAVQGAVRDALGLHTSLAPKIAAQLSLGAVLPAAAAA